MTKMEPGKITVISTIDMISINPQNPLANFVFGFHFCCELPLRDPVGFWTKDICIKNLIKIKFHGPNLVKIVGKTWQTARLQQGNLPYMKDISCEQPSCTECNENRKFKVVCIKLCEDGEHRLMQFISCVSTTSIFVITRYKNWKFIIERWSVTACNKVQLSVSFRFVQEVNTFIVS